MSVGQKILLWMLVLAVNACVAETTPPYARYPDYWEINDPWNANRAEYHGVVCYYDVKEGSELDMIFFVSYSTRTEGRHFTVDPYPNEYSCQSTVRNNKNFKPDPYSRDAIPLARCSGTPDECIVYRAHYNQGR